MGPTKPGWKCNLKFMISPSRFPRRFLVPTYLSKSVELWHNILATSRYISGHESIKTTSNIIKPCRILHLQGSPPGLSRKKPKERYRNSWWRLPKWLGSEMAPDCLDVSWKRRSGGGFVLLDSAWRATRWAVLADRYKWSHISPINGQKKWVTRVITYNHL